MSEAALAERIGISHPGILHHFATKQDPVATNTETQGTAGSQLSGSADTHQPFRLCRPRVALDRVQTEVEPPGAIEQTDTLIEQVMDLRSAFPGRLRAGAVVRWRADLRPAAAVRGDLGEHDTGEACHRALVGRRRGARGCGSFSGGPQPERRMRLSPHVALQ